MVSSCRRLWRVLPFIVALVLLAVPICRVDIPLLTDYPNHMARLYVEAKYAHSPNLQKFYFLRSGLFPYWAMDGFVQTLTPLLGLERAGRAFVVLAIVAPFLGSIALAKALHGRAGLGALCSALFCYNAAVAWGFLTFTFTMGLALAAFAAWIATERWPLVRRFPLFVISAAAIFLAHIFVFGMYCLLVLAWELPLAWQGRHSRPYRPPPNISLFLATLVPTLILYAFTQRLSVGVIYTYWGTILNHFWVIFYPTSFFYNAVEQCLYSAPLLILMIFALTKSKFDTRTKTVLSVFAYLSLIMPIMLSGVSFVHVRFPIMLSFLLLSALDIRLSAWTVVLVLATLGVRSTAIAAHLEHMDADVTAFRLASRSISAGSRVLLAVEDQSQGNSLNVFSGARDVSSYQHIGSFLIMDRQALYPYEFQMFQLGVKDAYQASTISPSLPIPFAYLSYHGDAPANPAEAQLFFWLGWQNKFDYVVVLDGGRPPSAVPSHLTLVETGAFFQIYKVS